MNYEEMLAPYQALPIPIGASYRTQEEFLKNDSPLAFLDLTPDQQETLINWCRQFRPVKSFYTGSTSYGLKHRFEDDGGFYICNGAFKGAMLIAGFKPSTFKSINWHFNISAKDVNTMLKRAYKRRGYR